MKNKIWVACLEALKHDIDDVEYQQWLAPLSATAHDDVLIIWAINLFFVRHIQKNYIQKITDLAKKYSEGAITRVDVKVQTTQKAERSRPVANALGGVVDESNALNVNYVFEGFVKGKSNALAYNACLDMAKKTSQSAYKSIFIYGLSGLGKTHLMQATAHRYQKMGHFVCYFTADSFMKKVGWAFLNNKVADFQKQVGRANLLIIDDVHLIPSNKKPQMANVLLGLYGDFVESGRRVILASDKQPAQMQGFDGRFLSRFSEGLTVAIEPPEIETRVQILEKKAAMLNLTLPKECAIFIAQNIPPDVRRLEGALNQVRANAEMMGVVIDLSVVQSALKTHVVARARAMNGEGIKVVVAEYFGISVKDLIGKKRLRQIARPRQIAMALTREFTSESYPDIGQAFGGRDHSTVIHACEKVAQLRQTDALFEKDYQALKATLEFS